MESYRAWIYDGLVKGVWKSFYKACQPWVDTVKSKRLNNDWPYLLFSKFLWIEDSLNA